MGNCLNCGDKIIQTPGKREKQYCDSTCRSNYFQKRKRLEKTGLTPSSPTILNTAKEKSQEKKEIKKPTVVKKQKTEEIQQAIPVGMSWRLKQKLGLK